MHSTSSLRSFPNVANIEGGEERFTIINVFFCFSGLQDEKQTKQNTIQQILQLEQSVSAGKDKL